MFHDRARIRVQAGRGGDGSLHFRREKHVPKGGPDGGDGGPGGDVVLTADPDLRDLSTFRAKRRFKAGSGEPGRGALKHGATGETVALPVPGRAQGVGREGQLTVADVPGLIEGASQGVGLGHEFLAHLERANILLHVIDAAEDDAATRFATIDEELGAYGAGLDQRPQVLVLNKIDLRSDPPAFDVDDERIVRVFHVSCATGAGIDELKRALFELCPSQAPEAAPEDGLVDFLVYRPRPGGRRFRILRTDRGFRIHGDVPADEAELAAALKAAGARTGDEVEVDGEVL